MLEELDKIQQAALEALASVKDEDTLQAWKVTHLGRSSGLMQVFSGLGKLSKEERPAVGQGANNVKVALENAFVERTNALRQSELARSLEEDALDITLPGRAFRPGRLHPATQNLRRVIAILSNMGFQVFTSRDVETDEYNFQLLNIPPHHPAREMQDTFYVDAGIEDDTYSVVLRTHTSPGQIHAMRAYSSTNPDNPPPLRVILPGMCYRYEQITARSEVQFNQVEGIAVGEGITFTDLKGTLSEFARRMFGQNARTRFRADYFPFTEPSAEMDVECFVCGGEGCPVCKKTGWLEILGCGMVNPIVLQNGGYDPTRYTGFAFGMGPERQLMLRHKIDDIRYFWGNDVRFLEQF
ncbi:MAG: phenylalanine--tRNA ligase subunit alpha [Anaerolineales bacterium]|nr:phenylalanine--tRNA ligase subunit alpha [Anaerolineales bacterium]